MGGGQLKVAGHPLYPAVTGICQELEGPDVRALVHPAYNLAVLRDGKSLYRRNGGRPGYTAPADRSVMPSPPWTLTLRASASRPSQIPLRKKGAEKGRMVVYIIFPVITRSDGTQILRGFSIEKIAFRLTHLCSRICRREPAEDSSAEQSQKVAVRWMPALLHTVCISVSLVCISTPQSWLQQVTRIAQPVVPGRRHTGHPSTHR